jgi:hypothetical protein
MQPTTNQTVPATSTVPVQIPNGGVKQPAPTPLDLDALRQVGGGAAPNTVW